MIDVGEIIYEMIPVSSLEKVFLDEEPVYDIETLNITGLKGEVISFQVAYSSNIPFRQLAKVEIKSPIKDNIKVYTVESVPVTRAAMTIVDDNYLRTTPGLYPDLLKPLPKDGVVKIRSGLWSSLWIDIEVDDSILAGKYPIEISLISLGESMGQAEANKARGEVFAKCKTSVEIYDVKLPKQEIIHTEWFYLDCLADYYKVKVFSDRHWKIISNFLNHYASMGCNMVLTPIFTYTLDTQVGKERTNVQLVDIEVKDGKYYFNYDNLKKWIDLVRSKDIEYFEISHIFSQWGAKFAPNIVATVDGKKKKIFGWDTPSVGEYTKFLEKFIPDLVAHLKEWGVLDKTYFHISDVPREEHIESYKEAYLSVNDLFKDLKTFEAVAHYDFFKKGLIELPVAASSVIHDFLDDDLDELWTYYCVGQFTEVANRFMSMPSARNRIFGIQMYKFNVSGFLHWGYNFYNSVLSYKKIDPYKVTDADDGFPAGDAFLVYPGRGGVPEPSIRSKVLSQAFYDERALSYLERLTSKEYVLDILERDLREPITFYEYPKSDAYLIRTRNRVNYELNKILNS
ncbi:DUF4091 domain-containing protein [Peptoniphilus duerdenii]|uniref:DUF4091 domain-containing protein n=1 Tax=Peptoniphilus duerdenii TaxID=507750 RepID=UPI00288AFEF8|nr:DUF4091 domain-containing protein [Peptoniphilus duerdenii]